MIPLSKEQEERLLEAAGVVSIEALNALFESVVIAKTSEEPGSIDYLKEDPIPMARRATAGGFVGQLLIPDNWTLKAAMPQLNINFAYVLEGRGDPQLPTHSAPYNPELMAMRGLGSMPL